MDINEFTDYVKKLVRRRKNAPQISSKLEGLCASLQESLDSKINELESKDVKLKFVGGVLNATATQNEAFARFVELVDNDYAAFANSVSLKEEVEAYTKLLALQRELARLLSLKAIANKSTIAVGGGFSAGKSQFVSSFFADNTIELPIGVTPVTAIASYIVHGDSHIIKGYTYKDGIIDVPLDLYARLSHDFIKELGFNLKDILPMMVMETPIPEYQHICFIDTPGYNPSDSGHTGKDKESASEYLANANALIWLISAQAGTFPASDLAFLDSLNLEGKKLYILLNKADLKPKSEIDSILDELEGVLEDNYMEYEGISAYDSRNKQELAYRKQPLKDFLHSVDKDIASREQLKSELDSVFAMYEGALEADKARLKNMRSIIGSLELDILQSGVDFDDRGEAVAQESEEEEEEITDKLVLLQQIGDKIREINEEWESSGVEYDMQDVLEHGNEAIKQELLDHCMHAHTAISEALKNKYADMDTENRTLCKLAVEYWGVAVDILQNGRYVMPESSEGDEPELMSEKIAARFETLRGFVSLGEIDKHSKELASLKAKMSEALESLIVEIFEKSADS